MFVLIMESFEITVLILRAFVKIASMLLPVRDLRSLLISSLLN